MAGIVVPPTSPLQATDFAARRDRRALVSATMTALMALAVVAVLVAVNDGRASVAVGVTDDLTARFLAAARDGDLPGLEALLADDVGDSLSPGGAADPAEARRHFGSVAALARFVEASRGTAAAQQG